MEDAPKLLKNPKSECPDIWIRFFFYEDKDENIGQAEIKEKLCLLTVRKPTSQHGVEGEVVALCHHSGRGWRFSSRNPQQPDGPTKIGQMHVHWHMQAWTTNGDAMPAVLDRRGYEVQSAPWLWPTDSRRREPPLTNGLRSQLREQPTGRGRDCPRALDKCAA